MPSWVWGLVVLYVVARSLGKYIGARFGARISGAEPVVRDNLGMALFAQGGVAVGLSIMAAERLGRIEVIEGMMLGDMIIFSVTASTLVVQLIGPPFVKLAVRRSGECGRDVQEEDVMAEWTVADVMTRGVAPIREQESVSRILQRFADADILVYPVVEKSGRIAGIISLESLKDVVPSRDCWDWMLASDVMAPSHDHVHEGMLLKDALDDMARLGEEALPVVQSRGSLEPVGVLDIRSAGRRVTEEVVRRRA